MKFKDVIIAEEKTRLDPKCWTGKKIGNPKTKMKGGVRVNNCVPAESVEEAANPAQQAAIAIAKKKKAGVAEAHQIPGKDEYYTLRNNIWTVYDGDEIVMEYRPLKGEIVGAKKLLARLDDEGYDVTHVVSPMGFATYMPGMDPRAHPEDLDEGSQQVDSLVTDALRIMQGPELKDAVQALKTVLGDRELSSRRGFYNSYIRQLMNMYGQQGVMEDFNGEYDDEAGMADNNLGTLRKAVDGLDELINRGDNLPEWCQEKIAVAENMLVNVWNYMQGEQEANDEDPEIAEMYEAMDQLAEEMAARKGVSADLVWETFEAMDDNMLYETAAWRRKEGKSKSGGLNAKGVASYRREHPGSKLQTAVTTKPSKLKKGSKAAKRRKSFCARMSGVKGPMKKPNGKPTRKALALRKWNC